MKTIRELLGYLIAGILLYFLITPFVQTQTHLQGERMEIQWGWLLCSFAAILFYWSVYLYPFARLLTALTQKHVPFRDAFTLFHLSNITRYLPGRIWGVVRLLSLSQRFGLSKTTGSSLTIHVGVETALGGLIAMSLLFSKQSRETATEVLETLSGKNTLLLTFTILGLLVGILFCIPRLADHARQFLKTLKPLSEDAQLWCGVLMGHVLLWLCQGTAFYLFVRSFAPVPFREAGVLTASFAFAWVVGFLSFLTPGGLGIREGLIGLLLANYMPSSQATLVALLCRLWMLSAEMILAGTAFLRHRRCYEKQTEVDDI